MVNLTATEIAKVFKARRSGRYKGRQSWQAKCPCHRDRMASLSITEPEPRKARVNCFAGCDDRDVLEAVGLSIGDLYADRRTMTPAVRGRIGLEEQRENLERQLALICWLSALEPGKWNALEKQTRVDLELLRCRIEPLKVIEEWREQRWRLMNRTQREAVMEGVWKNLQSR